MGDGIEEEEGMGICGGGLYANNMASFARILSVITPNLLTPCQKSKHTPISTFPGEV